MCHLRLFHPFVPACFTKFLGGGGRGPETSKMHRNDTFQGQPCCFESNSTSFQTHSPVLCRVLPNAPRVDVDEVLRDRSRSRDRTSERRRRRWRHSSSDSDSSSSRSSCERRSRHRRREEPRRKVLRPTSNILRDRKSPLRVKSHRRSHKSYWQHDDRDEDESTCNKYFDNTSGYEKKSNWKERETIVPREGKAVRNREVLKPKKLQEKELKDEGRSKLSNFVEKSRDSDEHDSGVK